MVEKQTQPFQLLFNASLKVDIEGSPVISDGSWLLDFPPLISIP